MGYADGVTGAGSPVPAGRPGLLAGQVISTQAPSRRARPRPFRLRRFNAAVRRLSQALLLATAR